MPYFRCLWWNSFTFWLWSHLCNWWNFSTPGYSLCNIFCQREQRNPSLQKHGVFRFKYKLKFHRKIIYNHRYSRKVHKPWTWKDIFWIWQHFQVRLLFLDQNFNLYYFIVTRFYDVELLSLSTTGSTDTTEWSKKSCSH